jgi:RNA polymerase sigma factor (TIGR02999 family)
MNSITYPPTGATESGYHGATNALFSALYSELHRLAKRELRRRWIPGALSVTTVLHDTYLNMVAHAGPSFTDHAHFKGYATRVMRGLIIDQVRKHNSIKRGGAFKITSLQSDEAGTPTDPKELEAIRDALDDLAKVDPGLAEVVDLKFFHGLSLAEIAAAQNLSERTVQRRWERARIYLRCVIRSAGRDGCEGTVLLKTPPLRNHD